jgi:PTS system nitrogen regulatory IIA component
MSARAQAYWKAFRPRACSANLAATEKDGALAEIVALLVAGRSLSSAQGHRALDALRERERAASTGVGLGVAIPHVAVEGIDRAVVSLCVNRRGIEWNAVDGAAVHLVFTVLRPERRRQRHDPGQHLEFMRWIARLVRDQDFRRFACAASTRDELVDLLRERAAP